VQSINWFIGFGRNSINRMAHEQHNTKKQQKMMSKDWRNMEKKPLKRNLKMKKTSLPGSILSQLGKEWWKNL